MDATPQSIQTFYANYVPVTFDRPAVMAVQSLLLPYLTVLVFLYRPCECIQDLIIGSISIERLVNTLTSVRKFYNDS
jgi:hypothetical protein